MVFTRNLSAMKKILNIIATILLLCSMVFLGGEWQEGVARKTVVKCDAIAIATMLACGLYLKKKEKNGDLD